VDAHRIVQEFVRPDQRDTLHDTLYEDAVSECLVVLLYHRRQKAEYKEPRAREAVERFVKAERSQRFALSFDDEGRTGLRHILGID